MLARVSRRLRAKIPPPMQLIWGVHEQLHWPAVVGYRLSVRPGQVTNYHDRSRSDVDLHRPVAATQDRRLHGAETPFDDLLSHLHCRLHVDTMTHTLTTSSTGPRLAR